MSSEARLGDRKEETNSQAFQAAQKKSNGGARLKDQKETSSK